MHRALLKLILGVAVALGLTLTAAPVASAASEAAVPGRAAPACTVQQSAAQGAQAAHAAADAKVAKLKKKIKKLKKRIKKAQRLHQRAKAVELTKKLKNKRKKIRQARLFRAKLATVVAGTSAAYAACQQGQISPIPGPGDQDNLLDYAGDLLDRIGLGDLVKSLGLGAVLDLLDQAGLLDLLGLGDLRS